MHANRVLRTNTLWWAESVEIGKLLFQFPWWMQKTNWADSGAREVLPPPSVGTEGQGQAAPLFTPPNRS